MAAGDIALNILINASSGNVSGVVGQVGQALSGLAGGGALGAVVGIGAAAATALVGVGASAVKAAGDFETMTNTLVTSAGESASNLAAVRKGILDISVSTGTSVEQLSGAMYQIESSGQHGAAGLQVLTAAAQGAKSENADLTTVAKALTTVLTDYHMPATQATSAMNGLIAVVQNGKTTLQQLAGSMGAVLPIASALGISFPQVGGSIATMTNAGMPAQQAAQNLAHVLTALSAPSAVAVKSMKSVGLSADEVKNALVNQGLPQALQMIEDHVGKQFPKGSVAYETALKNILGGIVGFKLAAMLTGDSLKTTEDNINKITAAMGSNASQVMGFDVVQSSLNFKIDQAKAAFQALLITLGTALLPIVGQAVGAITGFVTQLTQLVSGILNAGTAGKGLSTTFSMLGVAGKYLQSIFSLIGEAIGVVFGSQFKQASSVVSSFGKDAIQGLNSVLFTIDELLDPIVHQLLPALQRLQEAFTGNLLAAVKSFVSAFGGDLAKNFGSLDKSAAGLVPAIQGIANAMNAAASEVAKLKPVYEDLGAFIGHTLAPVFIQLATTFNTQVKPAWDDFMKALGPAMPAFKLIAEVVGVVLIGAFKLLFTLFAVEVQTFIMGIGLLIRGILMFVTSIVQGIGDMVTIWNTLKNAWEAAPGFFTNLWNTIKKAFSDAWDALASGAKSAWTAVQNAWGAVGQWFQNIGKAIQTDISDAWTWIQTTAKTVWNDIVKVVTGAVDGLIGSFQWLYNHNYYFQDLVDFIKKTFADGLAWLQTAWNSVTLWLTQTWDQISRVAGDTWQKVSTTIQQWVTTAIKFVQDKWSQFTTWLTGVWNSIVDAANTAWTAVATAFSDAWDAISTALDSLWNNISQWWTTTQNESKKSADDLWKQIGTVFSSAWNTYISKPLSTLATNISSWFNTQFTNFKTWGTNMLKMMGQGITAGVTYVTTAITNLGNSIVKLLGFHSPPASGPLATSDQWMPNMMKMLASGITAGIATVTTAVTNVATKIKSLLGISSPAQAGPLSTADKWMPAMMKMFASGITTNTALVTNATLKLANTINLQFTNMNTNVKTNVDGINNQLNLLDTQVQTSATNTSTQFMNLSANVTSSATNINNQMNSMNNIVPPIFVHVGSSATQAGQQVTQAGTQISSSSNQTAQNVDKASSSIKVSFGNTTKAATQTVQAVDESAQKAKDSMQQSQESIHDAAMQFSKAMDKVMSGYGNEAGQNFYMAFLNTANAAQEAAASIAASISSMLGHSTPKEGPMKDDNLWGKHFMENLVGGMQSGMPALAGATNTIASTLATVGLGPKASLSIGGGYGASSGKPQIIYIQLDKKTIGKAVTQYQTGELRVQGNIRNV